MKLQFFYFTFMDSLQINTDLPIAEPLPQRNSYDPVFKSHPISSRKSRLLRKVCEQASDAIVVYDFQGEILYANQAYQDLFGFLPTHTISEQLPFFSETSEKNKQ